MYMHVPSFVTAAAAAAIAALSLSFFFHQVRNKTKKKKKKIKMLMKNILSTKRYLSSSCTKGNTKKANANTNSINKQIPYILSLRHAYIQYTHTHYTQRKRDSNRDFCHAYKTMGQRQKEGIYKLPQGKIKKMFSSFVSLSYVKNRFSLNEYLCQLNVNSLLNWESYLDQMEIGKCLMIIAAVPLMNPQVYNIFLKNRF